ncbi:unnamed protein product [Closterium sp. NIES-53]
MLNELQLQRRTKTEQSCTGKNARAQQAAGDYEQQGEQQLGLAIAAEAAVVSRNRASRRAVRLGSAARLSWAARLRWVARLGKAARLGSWQRVAAAGCAARQDSAGAYRGRVQGRAATGAAAGQSRDKARLQGRGRDGRRRQGRDYRRPQGKAATGASSEQGRDRGGCRAEAATVAKAGLRLGWQQGGAATGGGCRVEAASGSEVRGSGRDRVVAGQRPRWAANRPRRAAKGLRRAAIRPRRAGRGAGGGIGRGRGGRGGCGGGAAPMKNGDNESELRDDRFLSQFFFVSTQALAAPKKDESFEEPAAVGKVTLHSLGYWVIDSGATYSMTPRADLLTELEPSPVKHVTSALGQRAEVKGMGKAMFKGADWKLVGLKNVLWVPNLAANLISVRRLQKAGMDTSSKGAKTYTARLGERVLWDLHEDSNVYNEMWQIPVVPMPKERQVAASISTKGEAVGSGDGANGRVKEIKSKKCNLGGTSKLGEHEESDAAAQKQHKGEKNPKAAAEEYGENISY